MSVIWSNKGTPFLVDDEDWVLLILYNWSENADGRYVSSKIGDQTTALHRLIMKAQRGQSVDHANGNTLDNRKCNLRLCSHRQNMRNAKTKASNQVGLKGVQIKPSGRFAARIRDEQGRRQYLGTFDTAEEAHAAYIVAAQKYHGEFARY